MDSGGFWWIPVDSNGYDGVREVSREGSFARGEFPKINLSGDACVTESGVCVMVRSREKFLKLLAQVVDSSCHIITQNN